MDIALLGPTPTAQSIAALALSGGHAVSVHGAEATAVMDCVEAVDADADRATLDGTTDRESATDGATLVVDASDDDVETRRERLADVEAAADGDPYLAMAGADVPVTAVAAGLRAPSQALGLNVVSPSADAVVEIVLADATGEAARECAERLVTDGDATPLVVRDGPGYALTRLDMAAIVEAIRLVEAGAVDADALDAGIERARGHPTGPLALADRIGLDAVLAALSSLAEGAGDHYEPPGLLAAKVDAGELGRQTGVGFYRWEDGERAGLAESTPGLVAHGSAPAPDPRDGPGGQR